MSQNSNPSSKCRIHIAKRTNWYGRRTRLSEEVGGTALGLVRVHGREGQPRVIVDGDVQELGADALDPIAVVSGNAYW